LLTKYQYNNDKMRYSIIYILYILADDNVTIKQLESIIESRDVEVDMLKLEISKRQEREESLRIQIATLQNQEYDKNSSPKSTAISPYSPRGQKPSQLSPTLSIRSVVRETVSGNGLLLLLPFF
jgi:hypothetical protein